MNTIKTIILTVVVTAIGYGAYLVITQEPPVAPEGAGDEWTEPPLMDLGGAAQGGAFSPLPSTVTPAVGTSQAPPFSAGPATTAPPFGGGDAPSFAPGPAPPGPTTPDPTAGAALAPPPEWAGPPPIDGGMILAPQPSASQAEAFGRGTSTLSATPANPQPAANPAGPAGFLPAGGPDLAAHSPAAAPQEPPTAAYPPATDPVASGAAWGSPGAMAATPGTAAPPTALAAQATVPASSFAAMMGSVQSKLDAQQYVEAHRELSQWYERRDLGEAERRQLLELLDALTGTVVYSRDFHAEPPYEVRPGDDLERIAQQYNVPWQFLQRINGVEDPRQLAPGQKLKVVRGPFRATVDLEAGQLTLWLEDRYAGRFPIGRNAPGATPEGEYQVQTKIENPSFYGADGTIEAGDPANPLGERWIELSEQVGIHGAADLNRVAHPDTAHCIRMSGSDVEDLYDILSVGSRITVRR